MRETYNERRGFISGEKAILYWKSETIENDMHVLYKNIGKVQLRVSHSRRGGVGYGNFEYHENFYCRG